MNSERRVQKNSRFRGLGPLAALRAMAIVLGLTTMGTSGAAKAESIFQIKSTSLSGALSTFDALAFQPFDPALGQLDEAVLTTQLTLLYSITTAPLVFPGSGFAPATIVGDIDLQLQGLGWSFFSQSQVDTNGTMVSGTQVVVPVTLNLTWRSDEISELLGFTSGTGSISTGSFDPLNPVTRDDYIATPFTAAAGLQLDLRSIWDVTSTTGILAASTNGGGTVQLEYLYTAPVPEPEIYSMLGVGLGLLTWVGRRRKRRGA